MSPRGGLSSKRTVRKPAAGRAAPSEPAKGRDPQRPPVVVEGALPDPVLADPVEVDVDDRAPRAVGEALALPQQVAALVDHRLAVPRQVGGRLALAGGGEDVRRDAARARRAHQQAAVLGAGDGDRAARQVEQHRRAGQRGLGARRHRHPHVLADLGVQPQAGHVGGLEDQVGPERHLRAEQPDRAAAAVVARREPAALVELAVGREVRLRRHAEHPAAVDDDGAVEHPGAVHERRADHDHRQQVGRADHDLADRRLHGVRAACPAGSRSSIA